MKILFTSTAGSGHFQALSTLARTLIDFGHTVKVAAPESFRSNVESAGFVFAPFDDSNKEHPAFGELHAAFGAGDPQKIEHLVGKIIFGLTNTEAALPKLEATVNEFKPDLIVSESAEPAGAILAAKHKIRFVRATPSLAMIDKSFTPHILDGIAALLEQHGLVKDEFYSWLMDQKLITYFPEDFELPSYKGPAGRVYRIRHEGSVLPLTKEEPPLIYVTIGTEAAKIGFYPRVIQGILNALGGINANILVAIGKEAQVDAVQNDRDNVSIQNWVNQVEVLSRASLVICHGGSGTTLDALAAGLPLIVVPLFADQPLNAESVQRTGCGYKVDLDKLDEELASKVQDALGGKANGSQAMREQMASYPSVSEVAKLIVD